MAQKTQAQILATERAGQVAHRAIKNINTVQKMAEINVYGVMVISYLHQAMYLITLFEVLTPANNIEEWVHRISGGIGAVLIPIGFDIFAIIAIKTGTTVGLQAGARKWGLGLLVIPSLMSGFVNVKSSLDGYGERGIWIAVIYVFVVALIPIVEFLKSKMQDIDYDAIDAIERRTLASGMAASEVDEAAGVVAPAKDLDPMMHLVVLAGGDIELARKIAKHGEMDQREKQSWTRKFNNALAKWKAEQAALLEAAAA